MTKFLIAASIPVLLVLFESALRVNGPEYSRPSTVITACATFVAEWASYIGQQIGRFTDIWYIIKDVFGKDAYALFKATYELLGSPLYVAKGYVMYYYMESNTPRGYAIFIIIFISIILFYVCYNHLDAIQAKIEEKTKNYYPIISTVGVFVGCVIITRMLFWSHVLVMQANA